MGCPVSKQDPFPALNSSKPGPPVTQLVFTSIKKINNPLSALIKVPETLALPRSPTTNPEHMHLLGTRVGLIK
jgi:hypothetical protein